MVGHIIFRIILEILLLFATGFFVEKFRGYYKYIRGRYVRNDKPIPVHAIVNLSGYLGICVVGFYDIYDNLQKILKLF